MDRTTAVFLVLLFAIFSLVAVRISLDFPQGYGIYTGDTRATNPEGTIRFTLAAQMQVTLIDPPDGTTYVITGTTRDINLTCRATNLSNINITQIRLYTDITGVFTITDTLNVSGTPPYTVTFNITGVPLGSYRWNCQAVSSGGQTATAPSDWHFIISQFVPPPPIIPGGGGGSKRPTREPTVTEEPTVPQPIPIIEIPLPPPPECNIIHEFTGSADLSLLQSLTNLRLKVPGKEDEKELNIKASEEDIKWIISEAEPLPAYLDEWDLLSTVRIWRLKKEEWQDFPLVAENKVLNYRPVKAARLSTGNSIPIGITTSATGEESRKNLTYSTIAFMPVSSPPYFVKFTEIVDGYVGIYFVLDGYHVKTVDNDFMIDFELSLNNELVLGDILSSAKLVPGEYNIIYKKYKLPDLPEKAMYDLVSRVYEKGPKLTNIAATYRSTVDFRKETPTQMGKTILS